MGHFNVYLIGSSQSLPLELEADNVRSLTHMLSRQRFIIGRFTAEAEDMALTAVMIPVSRIQMLHEAEQ